MSKWSLLPCSAYRIGALTKCRLAPRAFRSTQFRTHHVPVCEHDIHSLGRTPVSQTPVLHFPAPTISYHPRIASTTASRFWRQGQGFVLNGDREEDHTPGRVKLWSASSMRYKLCVPGDLFPNAPEYNTASYLRTHSTHSFHPSTTGIWDLRGDPRVLHPMNSQNVYVLWEFFPDDAGIPTVTFANLVRVYPERLGFSGNRGLVLVITDGFEGFDYPWV